MIRLSIQELDKIKEICNEEEVEYFELNQDNRSGIGSILTLTYDTFVADYPAKITVEVSGAETW